MYDYSLVYVLVDNKRLAYYNMLMKSVFSVRLHMPTITIKVLVDNETDKILADIKAELRSYATIIKVDVPDTYSQVAKSRYIKTNARKIITGDFLYMDTDTVICRPFPDVISDKSFAIVDDQNSTFDILQTPFSLKLNEFIGLQDISNLKNYFNSGIIWARDDEYSHRIYEQWYGLWEQKQDPGKFYDQPYLNYILCKEIENNSFGILDNIWNVQIAGSCNSGVRYLLDAYIIHYFGKRDCAFLLCQEKYYNLPYNDNLVKAILRDPLRSFGIGRLSGKATMPWAIYKRLEANHQIKKEIEESSQYRLLSYLFAHKKIFAITEQIAKMILKVVNANE